MNDSLSNISGKSGMPPGSLVHVGEIHESTSRISVVDYSKDSLEERSLQSIDELSAYRGRDTVTWVIIEGLANVEIVESVGKFFNIHPLVLEDILNTHQRPKFEEHDNYLYIVLKGLSAANESFSVNYEQISILVQGTFIFTFKEKVDDTFQPIQQRIRNSGVRFRSLGPDYLLYAILDVVVDQNFSLADTLSDKIDSLEEEVLAHPTPGTLSSIQEVKREVITIRRFIAPLREMLSSILRSDSELIEEKTLIYFRDVLDHAIRVSEIMDSYREMLSSLLDIYISSISNKMNEVMKVLTVFASIFIPLTFVAGVYGMNFDYMPELKWKWAYPGLWAGFVATAAGLLLYFRKKKWF